jgi:CRP-like cAMP-binding protein
MNGAPAAEARPSRWRNLGLSSRLLMLTLVFVMIAQIMIFVPSVASFRNSWLSDRLAGARIAALVLEAVPEEALPEDLVRQLLQTAGAETIALRIKGARRLLAFNDMPPMVVDTYDFRMMELVRTIDSIAFHHMDERLLAYLDKKAKATNSKVINATHQEIAYDLNASREAVSRLLKQLENDGRVKLGRNKIELN